MAVNIVPISDVRRNISQLVEIVNATGQPFYITHYSRPRAVLVDYEKYEALLAKIENLEGRGAPSSSLTCPKLP